MEPAYVRTGELREGRSVLLDETVPLAGRVQVTVQRIGAPPPRLSHADVLARIRTRQRDRGHVPSTKDEVDRRIAEERDSWD